MSSLVHLALCRTVALLKKGSPGGAIIAGVIKACVKRCNNHKSYSRIESSPPAKCHIGCVVKQAGPSGLMNGPRGAVFSLMFHLNLSKHKLGPLMGGIIERSHFRGCFSDAASSRCRGPQETSTCRAGLPCRSCPLRSAIPVRFHRSGHPLQIAVARSMWLTKPFDSIHLPVSPQAKVDDNRPWRMP